MAPLVVLVLVYRDGSVSFKSNASARIFFSNVILTIPNPNIIIKTTLGNNRVRCYMIGGVLWTFNHF